LSVIKFHHYDNDKELYKALIEFLAKPNNEEFKLHHERFTVLRQTGGNSALAIFIAGVLLVIRQWAPSSWSFWTLWIFGAILAVSLYAGHKVHITGQEKWRNAIKEKLEFKPPPKPSSK